MVRESTQRAVDRIVGVSIALGMSVALVRFTYLVAARRGRRRGDDSRGEGWIRTAITMLALRQAIADSDEEGNEADASEGGGSDGDEEIDAGDNWVDHFGSCHCGAIVFALRGPRRLRQTPSKDRSSGTDADGDKIWYPRVVATAERFRLVQGSRDVRFYRVKRELLQDDNGDDDGGDGDSSTDAPCDDARRRFGSHAFCGNCGVHLLRAPSRDSGELEINAQCLDDGGDSESRQMRSASLASGGTTGEEGGGEGSSHRLRGPPSPSLSSMSSHTATGGGDNDIAAATGEFFLPPAASLSNIATVSEHEPFLGGGHKKHQQDPCVDQGDNEFWRDLRGQPRQQQRRKPPRPPRPQRKGSIDSAPDYTAAAPKSRSESFDAAVAAKESTSVGGEVDGDDISSMGSSALPGSITSPPMTNESLPRLPIRPGTEGSVRTLPPRWESSDDGGVGPARGRSGSLLSSGGWSTAASLDFNDSGSVTGSVSVSGMSSASVSGLDTKRMKHFMSRHMKNPAAESGAGSSDGRTSNSLRRRGQKQRSVGKNS